MTLLSGGGCLLFFPFFSLSIAPPPNFSHQPYIYIHTCERPSFIIKIKIFQLLLFFSALIQHNNNKTEICSSSARQEKEINTDTHIHTHTHTSPLPSHLPRQVNYNTYNEKFQVVVPRQ
mmetsp:Transcript_48572/g.117494  ORF Transcript_48572/g.117494 Transcript_48572/m.117494 type:complete len:119 (+) Transcript_48572:359-715(+)